MENMSTSAAYSLKVSKTMGEKASKLVARLGLLNKDLKFRQVGEHLCVPLVGKPSADQSAEIRKELPYSELLIQDFSVRKKHPKILIDILRARLPPGLLASFRRSIEFVGDIAVLEIPPELEGYKELIGESVLEVHRQARTVLAKSSAVGGVFRLRDYEIIAGSIGTETVHKEHGCKYLLDLKKVYFSTKLSHERCRVASRANESETVIDLFTGVGPFSILIGKTHAQVKVYAIDVNPDAIRYLKKNILLNRVQEKVIPILGDAREVVDTWLRESADRVIMNLPERAYEYLETACRAMKPKGGLIHYYEFIKGANSLEMIRSRLTEKLNHIGFTAEDFSTMRFVREVAPFKWQVVIDIRIRHV